MRVLAADVGGTKTRLAFFRSEAGALVAEGEREVRSGEYPGLPDVVRGFLGEEKAPDAAVIGVPGPVAGGEVRTPNLPWAVSRSGLAETLGTDAFRIINDLEATALGLAELAPEDFQVLASGSPDAGGNAALLAPGTGLGEAGLFWDGARHRPFATEGGHTDFAPADPLEFALHQALAQRYGHVSWERVLSGPGLVALHAFLCDYRNRPAPDWLRAALEREDPAAAITSAAREGSCPVCTEAVERFVRLLGAEAGNLALKLMATGGVYLGGGIPPRIAHWLRDGELVRAFRDKGRHRALMERIPISLVVNDRAALLGAARCAVRAASGS